MHPNQKLIEDFYAAFAKQDGDAMAGFYAPDATFSDPVFQNLQGARVSGMWKMLCARAKDFRLKASDFHADDREGRAHWEAWYTFGATGRPVHNVIDARFTFRDGRIATHVDAFDLWRWTRQALGPAGLLLGWTPMLQNKVRGQAVKGLDAYMASGK